MGYTCHCYSNIWYFVNHVCKIIHHVMVLMIIVRHMQQQGNSIPFTGLFYENEIPFYTCKNQFYAGEIDFYKYQNHFYRSEI